MPVCTGLATCVRIHQNVALWRISGAARPAVGGRKTGDLARMDEDGYIRIVGRAKDIIIRGGENVPVVEVEELIYRHPAVHDVAVVAMPDERLGERGCAFVQTNAGANFTFDAMVDHLLEAGMSKTYLPERLELVDEHLAV